MKEGRENKRGIGARVLSIVLSLALLFGSLTGAISIREEMESKAADEPNLWITWHEQPLDPTEVYDLRDKTMELGLKTASGTAYDDKDVYQVRWSVGSATNVTIAEDVSSQARSIVTALAPGKAQVTVTVFDKTGGSYTQIGTTSCQINVVFSVDTSVDDSIFKTVYKSDDVRSLVLYADDSPVQMTLNFGDAKDAQWSVDNEEVVKVGQRTGLVTPRGAGFTHIRTTYTPSGSTTTLSATLDVYVIPKARNEESMTYSTNPTVQVDSGGYFYTDTLFENNKEAIRGKIYWSVRQEDGTGGRKEIANSLGKESDLISVNPTGSMTNQMQVSGTSGEYYVYLYPYNSAHREHIDEVDETKTISPTVVHLIIKSAIYDKPVTLGIGDVLDLAKNYNMTTKDFHDTFTVTRTVGSAPADNYLSYNNVDETVTALREATVNVRMTIRSGKEKYVAGLLGYSEVSELPKTYFDTTVTIVDGITLGDSSIVLMVGQEYQLHASLHGTYTGTINWRSADNSYVTVSDTGVIKGIKVTGNDVPVTASVNVAGGVIRTATCQVKVETAMTDFTLNPGTNQIMDVGRVMTIEAKIKETVSVAPLRWISSKPEYFTVTPAADGKTAVINALAGGTGTLMVENTLNGKMVSIDIEVRIPVETLEFTQPEYTFPFYQTGHNMLQELKMAPDNITSSSLIWSVDLTSVATIDKSGYLKFGNPGTISLSVRPEYNPNNIYATCIIKITGGPDNIIFENLQNDTLNIEVGQEFYVNLKFTPETAETTLDLPVSKPDIIHVSYDTDRKQIRVIGQAPGSVTVTVITEDRLSFPFYVNVTQAASGIAFKDPSITLINGDVRQGTKQLEPILTPTSSTETVSYESDDTSIATVDATGLVTAVAAGDTLVLARTSSGKVAIIKVYVLDMVTELIQDTDQLIVYVGKKKTIKPTVMPATASNKKITWTWSAIGGTGSISMEEKTSSVVVTGVSPGNIKLIGTSEDNHAAKVIYFLTVKYKTPQYTTKVTLTPKVKYVNVGKSFRVGRKVTGAYKGNKKLKWKSSNKKVATVSKKGKVKAKKVGKATITATAQDGSKAKGKMKVVVRRLVTKIKMNRSTATILVGDSVKLSVRVTPSNASVKGVTWKSSNTSIATVNGGKVIGIAPGIVKITATSKDVKKKKTSCWVTVKERVDATGFTVADPSLIVAKGKAVQSGITVTPANATTDVTYWSDNKYVATVSSRGKITSHHVGQATIYARAANGVEAFVDVTVVDLNRKALTLRQYDTEQLSIAGITTGIKWYSANPNIAKVSNDGTVTGRTPGVTIIYAVIENVKLGCRVTVKRIR